MIVGGFPIEIAKVPYQVSLQIDGSHLCGGSIISSKWILTAAHCTKLGYTDRFSVRIGSTKHAGGGQVLKVVKVVFHPRYSGNDPAIYDLSLVELEHELQFNSSIKKIKLARGEPKAGSMGLVSGWGDTHSPWESNAILRATHVPIVTRDDCSKAYGARIPESMICAGFLWQGGKDSCQNDSGGPLVIDGQLVGVVSWGEGCALAGYPGVYSNVAAVLDWINETINV
ncbi:trypsin-1-like [Uranotaenia lowii]|uniref:trypsin-1-like n=1 Tax=Uranotaenia lowii TaxID=190385 RepID=UPI00247A1EE1|nr:trypsin-1-like [Uranotaenia lowii]